MPAHPRAYRLLSFAANYFAPACAFSSFERAASSVTLVGRRLQAPASRAYLVPIRGSCSTMMEAGSKATTRGSENQGLKDEVRTAVKGLRWPPLASRGWSAPDGIGEAADKTGDSGSPTRIESVFGGARLKVLQWNILCDGLSGSHPQKGGFVRAPAGSLDWDKRRWKILEEIVRWDCDVLALQEVDHHHDWLSPMLEKQGYHGIFIKKPSAPGLEYNPTLEDGCSLFYRANSGAGDTEVEQRTTLELLDSHSFTFAVVEDDITGVNGQEESARTAGAAGEQVKHVPVVQNQVATVALLRVSINNQSEGGKTAVEGMQHTLVLVASTHLKASKDEHGEVVRARQAAQLLHEVDRFRAGHEAGRGLPARSIPLVVAGDFNATPHPSDSGGLDDGGYEPLCYRRIMANTLGLRSAFPVDSTFTTWKIRPKSGAVASGAGATPNVDAMETKETKHCIDYVWVSGDVQIARRSTFPTAEELGPDRAPSFVYPSDHFALAVELRLPY